MGKQKTKEEFIVDAIKVHDDKYDYSQFEYVKSKIKSTIICYKHGPFLQNPNCHLMGNGCPDCGLERRLFFRRSNTEEFIAKAITVHGNKYDYSQFEYVNSRTKSVIVCPEHGPWSPTPANHLKGAGCPVCGIKKNSEARQYNTEEFIAKAIKVHNDKYDYSQFEYDRKYTKSIIVCQRHGAFLQTSDDHLAGCGCPDCAHERLIDALRSNTQEFIEKAITVHGNKYDYSQFEYGRRNTKSTIICSKHGSFLQEAGAHLSGSGCPRCKNSKGENVITQHLKQRNVKFSSQHRFLNSTISSYRFDFFVNDIVIEFQGSQHYIPYSWGSNKKNAGEINLADSIRRDSDKSNWCKANNVEMWVIPFWDIDRIPEFLDALIDGQKKPNPSPPPKMVVDHNPTRMNLFQELKNRNQFKDNATAIPAYLMVA